MSKPKYQFDGSNLSGEFQGKMTGLAIFGTVSSNEPGFQDKYDAWVEKQKALIAQAPAMYEALKKVLGLLLDQSAINLEKEGYLKGDLELGIAISVLTGLNRSKIAKEARNILTTINGE